MKKSLLYLSAALTVFAFMAACSKEQSQPAPEVNTPGEEEIVPASGELVTIKFKADYPVPTETKTDISDAGIVSWKAGDEVTLYYIESGNPASTTATALADGPSVEFSATIPSGITALWAAYPAGSGNLAVGDVFTINTAATPTGVFADANFAVAHTAITDINDVSMSFKNAVGLFCIPIPAGGVISHGGESYTIGAIEISSKSGSPSFLGTVTVTDNAGELAFSEPDSPVTSTAITLDAAARSQSYVYIPSLPITASDGLVFRFTDTGGKTIPAAVTKDEKAITLERGHLKPSAAVDGIVWDWYYSPDGAGDGKSAAAPANLAAFQSILNATSTDYGQWRLNGAVLHLADGTYSLTAQLLITGSETGEYVIEGESRDGVMIDGATLAKQMVRITSAANCTFRNLTLQNALNTAKGSALSTDGASGTLTMENCKLYNNQTTGSNSGAVFVGAGTRFENCLFDSNKANTQGGAFSIGGAVSAPVYVQDCSFQYNKVTATGSNGGGAIYDAGVGTLYIDNSIFEENSCAKGGGAIKIDSKDGLRVFINRSLFRSNSITRDSAYDNLAGGIYVTGDKSALGLYNCTFNYNHASAGSTSAVTAYKYIVANCTFVESVKVSKGAVCNLATNDHWSTIVNSILITTSTNTSHFGLSMDGDAKNNHLDCGYNLYTRIQTDFTAASNDATSYTPVVKSDFGFADAVDVANRCYAWSGDVSAFTGYSKCSLSQVEKLIKANTVIGNDFWNWLKGITVTYGGTDYDATQVDVRGVPRNTTMLWPGSYQQD